MYYQLRWKEIVAKLEADLSRQDQSPDWLLSQSAAVWTAIETCWSDRVFLVELAPRFWRLSLQVRLALHLPLHLSLMPETDVFKVQGTLTETFGG